MKKYLVVILGILVAGAVMATSATPTEIPNKSFVPSAYAEKDMFYYGTPSWYWTLTGSNFTLAGYFEPAKFSVAVNFRIKTIGFMGYSANGPADIYVYLNETSNHPNDTPPTFTNKKYGPFTWHINNTYPSMDDWNAYSQNWYLKISDINAQTNKRFWVLWHLKTSPPPYPISDESTASKNSMIYIPGTGWTNTMSGYYPCWCCHVVVEYPPASVASTSIGVVKALFN